MSKIQAIAEAATLGAISIGANIVTGTQNVIDTVLGGDALPQVVEASSASAIPRPDTISTVMDIITQLAYYSVQKSSFHPSQLSLEEHHLQE